MIQSPAGQPSPWKQIHGKQRCSYRTLMAWFCQFISLPQSTAGLNYNSIIYILTNISHIMCKRITSPSHRSKQNIRLQLHWEVGRPCVCFLRVINKINSRGGGAEGTCQSVAYTTPWRHTRRHTHFHCFPARGSTAQMKLHACRAVPMLTAQTKRATACIF